MKNTLNITHIPSSYEGLSHDQLVMLALLEKDDAHTQLWTRKCVRDAQSLAFEIKDIRALLKQVLLNGRYLNSEWCVQKPTGPWAACDSYLLARME